MEIASGTGEHAAYFCSDCELSPHLLYQPTEPLESMHESIKAWCQAYSNILSPLCLDVNDFNSDSIFPTEFQSQQTNAVICINMIHISPWSSTSALFKLGHTIIKPGGLLITYGPYRVNGQMVASNIDFDLSLKSRNVEWGIRDIEDVEKIGQNYGFILEQTIEMPANNLTLLFRRM